MHRRFPGRRRARLLAALLGAVVLHAVEGRALHGQPAGQVLLSSNPQGAPGDGDSTLPAISLDGSSIAFQSAAADLDRADTDRIPDVYLTPASPPRPILVSVSSAPDLIKGNGPSGFPSLNADGSRVLFTSSSDNLVGADRNRFTDVFLREIARGTTERISVSSAGVEGDEASDRGVLAAGGKVAVFQSRAGNLASPGAQRGTHRIHVRDLASGTTARIDLPGGSPADADCLLPDVSADGRWVVFHTASRGFGRDGNDFEDVYRHDLATGQTARVSVGPHGAEPDGPSSNPRISPDGRFVAFDSLASNLAGRDTNRVLDVYLRDMVTGVTERVSLPHGRLESSFAASVTDLSDGGRFVLFTTAAPLLPEDKNERDDVYARDRLRSSFTLVSATYLRDPPGAPSGASGSGVTSGDGHRFAFDSVAPDIVPNDSGARSDVFLLGIEGPRAGPFPASNHLLFTGDGALLQVDLAGKLTGRSLAIGAIPLAVAVDDANAVWIVAAGRLGRFESLGLEPPAGEQGFFTDVPGQNVHSIAAAGGFAWVAVDASILRLSPGAEPLRLQLRELPDAVSLALDPEGRLWAGIAGPDSHELLNLTRDLRLLHSVRRPMPDPFRAIAFDDRGSLLARSRGEIVKLAPAGGRVWASQLPPGQDIAVDGDGNSFTFAGREVVGLRPDGRIFLRVPHGSPQLSPRSRLTIDGEGRLWVFLEGAGAALAISPAATPPSVVSFPLPSVGSQPVGDTSGYVAANVVSPAGDMDGDGFLNRDETKGRFNPFRGDDPSRNRRLLPVIGLTATPIAAHEVRLSWSSPEPYDFLFVFRDGRQIPGSPFLYDAAAAGTIDRDVPGGPHTYRVIGQGFQGRGGGAGLGQDVTIDEPFSFTTEVSVTLGEGAIRAVVGVDPAPDAVVHDAAASRILAALEGGILVTLDEGLAFVEETVLPADPFAAAEIRGLAIDAADPLRPLYLLLGDGRIFKRMGAGAPVPFVTLNGPTPSEAGYTGLALTADLFTTMAGPDVDCLIGFLRTGGGFQGEASVSGALGIDVAISVGLSRLGTDLLLGTGTGASGATSIQRVSKLGLSPGFALSDGSANLPLTALGSTDISGFDFAPGLGLIVADRSGSRVAILEATFPGSPRVLSITPGAGHFARATAGVVIAGTGFGADLADLWVGFGGVTMPITAFDAGVGRITVGAEAPGHPLEVEVELFSGSGSDLLVPGFTFGFQRGDSNDDGALDISDAGRILMHLFAGAPDPPCPDAADLDDSEDLDITDAVRLLNFLFIGGPEPPAPFPGHGLDLAGEGLGCGDL